MCAVFLPKSLMLSKSMLSRMVQSCKFIVKTIYFEGLTGCVCEQKMYQNIIQIDTKIRVKLMKIEADTIFEKVMQIIQKTIAGLSASLASCWCCRASRAS